MGLFHSLYRIFVTRPSGGYILAVLDLIILLGTALVTVLVRRSSYGSFETGADAVIGFLMGLTIVACFNSMVFFGAFGYRPPVARRR